MPEGTASRLSTGKSITPTNKVSWETQAIRARIDPRLPAADVVRQLCVSFSIQAPPNDYCIRVIESEELVTDANLRHVVENKHALRLGPSPLVLAKSLSETIRDPLTTPSALKLALFSLQKQTKEEAFCEAFCSNHIGELDAVEGLLLLESRLEGNALAYLFQAVDGLLAYNFGFGSLSASFVRRIIDIVSSPSPPINVSRSATAILRSIIPGPGFELVYSALREQPVLLERLVERLRSEEAGESLGSLRLINSLLSGGGDGMLDLMADLDRLGVKTTIQALMHPPTDLMLTEALLDFQSNLLRATFHLHRASVNTAYISTHRRLFEEIWDATGCISLPSGLTRERALGLDLQPGGRAVWKTGFLGLRSLHSFAYDDRAKFSQTIQDQLLLSEDYRCEIGKASNECVEALLEFWQVSDHASATTFSPLFLSFARIHSLCTDLFVRMWTESNASQSEGDFPRVAALVRDQLNRMLQDEARFFEKGAIAWQKVEKGFRLCEYKELRSRQLASAAANDEMLSKPPIKALRSSIFEECYGFVKEQRIKCLLEGAWFMHGTPVGAVARDSRRKLANGWTFIRLAPNRKTLAYTDAQNPHRDYSQLSLDELNEQVNVRDISEIATQTCFATAVPSSSASIIKERPGDRETLRPSGTTGRAVSDLSFSLLAGKGTSLLDLVALDSAQFSEWVDGINLLRSECARVATEETRELIEQLTEIGLKIRLLDISGEQALVPDRLLPPPPPSNCDFFFADPV